MTVNADPDRGAVRPDSEINLLSAAMEIANLINSRLDLNHVLSRISRELGRVIDYDLGCVAIYEEEEDCLYIRHIYRKNGDDSSEGRFVPLDENNLIGWVALNRKPVYRPEIEKDDRFREIMKEDNLRSDIVVPMTAHDSLIGTVNIGSYRPNNFSDFDVDLVAKFSRLTSIAVKNSILFEERKVLGQKYSNLMQNAKDIILLIDLSGKIVECSNSVTDIFGYSQRDLIGKEIFSYTLPERRDQSTKLFAKILQAEIDHLSSIPYLKKDGRTAYLDIDPIIMRIKGHPYVLALGHDITERKFLEEKITVQNEELRDNNRKLMELDRMKSEFLGRVSHELRTPLSVIMAYVGALLEEDGNDPIEPETKGEFLKVISLQSNKLLSTINDLLDLSTVEVSGTTMNMSQGSINEILKISAMLIEPSARRKRIRVRLDLDRSLPIINFDPHRIQQICYNMLGNAVKFTREGEEVLVRSFGDEKEVTVAISDSGPGIDSEDIERIFDDFTQLDGGPTRLWEGMGIGLRLVKHYVELHGGRVWVESEEEKGSTFYFSIPAIQSMSNLPRYSD